MTVNLERFAAADDAFAVRFGRDALPGILSKRLDVPAHHVALVRTEAGDAKAFEGGEGTDEVAAGVLVKARARLELGDLDVGRSKDNLSFKASLGLELETRRTPLDLGQLERELLPGDQQECSLASLRKKYFEPYVREALRVFVSARDAQGLASGDFRQALDGHLRQELQKPCFESGLQLEDVLHPSFASAGFEARREAEEKAEAQARQIQAEREILELKKQLDKHALLADIELQEEASTARKERRLERYEVLRSRMGDDDVKALIMMLDDDKQRSVLIRELIDKDLSPEQRAGVKVTEMEHRVEERLVELQQKLAQLTGTELKGHASDRLTRRVLCVVGKRILSFDPKTNLHPEVPKEVYDTEDGGLGYLRSVRVDMIRDEEWLLAGAQRGIYRLQGDKRVEHAFAVEPKGKGGINAVAYFDQRLYATHSEMGLMEWQLDGGPPRVLCADYLRDAGSVRGASVVDGRLYFSAGADIYALDLATGSDKPVKYRGSDDSVTSFIAQRDELVAGNRAGKTYRWSLDDPNSPESFGVLKQNPIFMLRHAQIAGQGFYLIGSKDYTVTAAEPRKDLYREYQAREEVRWVDGAGDYIFGVSRSGYKVFVWDTLKQAEPKLTVRVSDKVQDLFVIRGERAAT